MHFSRLNDNQRAELWASLALIYLHGLGATQRKRLADHFGSPYKAICAVEEWDSETHALGLDSRFIRLYQRGGWRTKAKVQWQSIQECPAGVLLYSDPMYPALLKELPDAPLILFYLGDITLLNTPSIAVVGARDCTSEGMSVAVNIVRGLSHAGITTISGLAKGIDRVVHLAGLEGEGKSIAVLGSGIDVPYPKSNLDLYDLMREKGLIISEFVPGSAPISHHFPIRNRIISGLARGVLVVEAAVRSGTLITARHAIEQNREVFAVPGSTVSETSEGCRELIRKGAKAVFSAEDIILELAPILRAEVEKNRSELNSAAVSSNKPKDELRDFGMLPWEGLAVKNTPAEREIKAPPAAPEVPQDELQKKCQGLSEDEVTILGLLNKKVNCHIDIISNELMLDVAKLSGLLTVLEVKGLVRRDPGMLYSLRL